MDTFQGYPEQQPTFSFIFRPLEDDPRQMQKHFRVYAASFSQAKFAAYLHLFIWCKTHGLEMPDEILESC